MKWFNNLKIGNKLIISFCIISAFTVIVGIQGLSNMSDINNMLNSLYLNETMGISYIKEANIDLIYFGRAQNNYFLASSAEERQKYRARMEEYEGLMLSNVEKATPLIHSELGKKYLADLRTQWTEYKEIVRKIVELGSSEALDAKRASVTMAQSVGREKSDEIDSLLSRLARIKEGNGRKAYDDSDIIYADSKRLMIILIIGALGVGISFGMFIARAISRPVKQGVKFAEDIASGDLTTTLTVDQEDEIGQLAKALNSMAAKLREVVQDVKSAADNVATGSQELSSSSEQMSQGATEQAAAAEEASSSMEEMTSNISQNA
ncbi:MAG: MCP four helix bundle domain-containing protein, partial [Syntrophothermus sp.]